MTDAEYFKYELLEKAMPREDWRLDVVFRNGVCGVFDCTPYLSRKFWQRLNDPMFFKMVTVEHGTLAWPDDIDIEPEEVWHNSVKG